MRTNVTFTPKLWKIDLSARLAMLERATGTVHRVYVGDPAAERMASSLAALPVWRLVVCVQSGSSYQQATSRGLQSVSMLAGNLLVQPPHAALDPIQSLPAQSLGFLFDTEASMLCYAHRYLESDGALAHWRAPMEPLVDTAPATRARCLELLAGLADRPPGDPVLLAAGQVLVRHIMQIMGEARPVSGSGRAERSFLDLRGLLEVNLQYPLTREDVGRELAIHPNHVSRLCRQQGGVSFVELLRGLRLARAHAIRTSSRRSWKEIAAETGFRSPGYLATLYRRRFPDSE